MTTQFYRFPRGLGAHFSLKVDAERRSQAAIRNENMVRIESLLKIQILVMIEQKGSLHAMTLGHNQRDLFFYI